MAHVEKVLKEMKGKKFKSIKEAHKKFNPKGAYKTKYVEKDPWGEEFERIGDELIIEEGKSKWFLALPINAEGKIITNWGKKGGIYYECIDRCAEIGINILETDNPLLRYKGYKVGSCKIIIYTTCPGPEHHNCYASSRYQIIVIPKNENK